MPIKPVTCWVAACDICGFEYGADFDDRGGLHFAIPKSAVDHVRRDREWLVTADHQVICLDFDDAEHRAALNAMLPPDPAAVCDGQIPLDLGRTE
ncbi:hypothetical protein [Kitasatospora sp. NPDC051702]|uniref:hypothetical protein n=1 Tax=Kitasatospora sp. NPDC051702 TaxID=3155672 RepID=UPI00343DB7AD